MSAQTRYGYATPIGAPGGIVDLAPYAIDTFLNDEENGVLKFGMGVVQGSKPGVNIALPAAGATADKFEGIATNNRTTEYDMDGRVFVRKGVGVGVMRYGRIYVRVKTGDAPEYGVCGVDDTVEVGDFSAFGCYIMDEGNDFDLESLTSFTYEVTSVEDGIVTYDYVSTEGVLREYTTTVTDFATFDDDSYALEGQAVVGTNYGERLCDVYVKDDTGMTMLVGAGDDVIYAMVVYEGETAFYYALEYSTEVYGDHPYDTDLPQDSSCESVGDYYTVIIQVNEADGTKWSGIYAQLKVGEIDGQGYTQREWFGYTPDDAVAGTLFSTTEDDGPVGTVVVNTVYGAIECDFITYVYESGTVMTGAYYGGYPIWENYEYTDGVSATYTYYYNSVVAGGADYGSCVQEIPEAGDTMDLVYVYPDGEYYEIEQKILSVEDGMIVIEQEGTEYEYPLDLFIDGFDRDGATYRGQALVATLYGYRVCDVWSDDGGIYLLGADDGVNYISAYADGYVVYFSSDDFIFEV